MNCVFLNLELRGTEAELREARSRLEGKIEEIGCAFLLRGEETVRFLANQPPFAPLEVVVTDEGILLKFNQ